MVVKFTPTPEGEPARRRGARSGTGSTGGSSRPVRAASGGQGDGHLAPVSYLPGARPSEAAEKAMRRVESVRRADAGGAGAGAARASRRAESGRGASRAANVSMHQLARRGMSRWELRQVLDKRGVDEATATAELDRLQSVGLLDDAALALTLVYTQHTRKGLGRSAIAQELRRRHIDQAIIDDALSEIEDDDELQRALELAHKRAAQLHGLDAQTARRRLSGYLARKGYGSDVLRAAMASVFDGAAFTDAPFDGAAFEDLTDDDEDPTDDGA